MSDPPNVGVARYVGSVPNASDDALTSLYEEPLAQFDELARLLEDHIASLEVGDVELYHVDPPLEGFHVIAATQMPWAIRYRYIGEDGPVDDPVSTTFYGVSGGESVHIERDQPLADTADGMNPTRAFGELGYVVR